MAEANKVQYVRRDLILEELPETRDVGQQTSVVGVDASAQTEETEAESGTPVAEPRPPTIAKLFPVGCWNCHGVGHAYPRCQLPRMQSFCYGCGAQNVTLANCCRCGPRYKTTRPYTARRCSRDRRRYVDVEDVLAWPWMARQVPK